MNNLQNYYGKKLAYIITKLNNGKIETKQEIKTVYDPRDFSRRVAPASGCDLVIGDNSTESKYIFLRIFKCTYADVFLHHLLIQAGHGDSNKHPS